MAFGTKLALRCHHTNTIARARKLKCHARNVIRIDAEVLRNMGYDLTRMTAKLIKRLSKRHGPAPAWSDAAAHAAVLEATVVHYGHAQDERSLSVRSSPSDKPVTGGSDTPRGIAG